MDSAKLAELEQRAIVLGERFATSTELGEALHVAHGAVDPRTAALVEELAKNPYALSRAFNDI